MTQHINMKSAVLAGTVAGVVSGLVKLGWENLLPPRTPERDATNPPQQLLEQMGVPASVTHATYTYSGHQEPFVSYLMHFGFSTTFAVLYSVGKHYVPAISAGHGTAAGLVLFGTFHHGILPALGTIPRAKDQPAEEHISEALGHVAWMRTIDIVSDQLYQRFNHDDQ